MWYYVVRWESTKVSDEPDAMPSGYMWAVGCSELLVPIHIQKTSYLCIQEPHFSALILLKKMFLSFAYRFHVTNSTERSPSWATTSFSPSQEILHTSWNMNRHRASHNSCPSQLPSLDHSNIWQGKQIVTLLIMQFTPPYSSSNFFPLRLKYLSPHPILKHPWPVFLASSQRPTFTLSYKTGKIIFLYM